MQNKNKGPKGSFTGDDELCDFGLSSPTVLVSHSTLNISFINIKVECTCILLWLFVVLNIGLLILCTIPTYTLMHLPLSNDLEELVYRCVAFNARCYNT